MRLLVTLLCGLFSAQSYANTTTFEGLNGPNPTSSSVAAVPSSYNGFEWNSFAIRAGGNLNTFFAQGEQANRNNLFGNVMGYASLTKSQGATFSSGMQFDLNELDMLLIGGHGYDSSAGTTHFSNVQINGLKNGQIVESKVLALRNGLSASTPTPFPTAEYHFIFNWKAINDIQIIMPNNAIGTDRQILIDNINTAPVPEPETYAMMLAGLGVVGWSMRNRKQA